MNCVNCGGRITKDGCTCTMPQNMWADTYGEWSGAQFEMPSDSTEYIRADMYEQRVAELEAALEAVIEKVSTEPVHPLMIEIRDIIEAALKANIPAPIKYCIHCEKSHSTDLKCPDRPPKLCRGCWMTTESPKGEECNHVK